MAERRSGSIGHGCDLVVWHHDAVGKHRRSKSGGLLRARMLVVGVKRECSKVLLVDEQERILLFAGIDRTKPDVPPRWFPVGGALEPGETLAQAAVREVREETGLMIEDPGPIVFTRSFSWDFEGDEYDQEEAYFFVRVECFTPPSTGWSHTEAATIRGIRWWSIEDLRSTDEEVFPEDLAGGLERLLGR